MKISIIFLQIYLLSVACSPNLDYRVNAPMGVAVESNSAEEGKIGSIGSIGGMKVLYPKDSYTVSGSTYSDTTTATINGVPAQSYAGPNGEIVVLIPENLKNGRLNIEVSNSNDSLNIDNVFHLNDPSIPLFSGSASLMCSSTQFYNANGDLTTGTKLCASDDSNFKAENIKVGISVAGVTGTYAAPSAPALCSASVLTACTTGTNFPAMVLADAEDKILLGESLGGVTGNVVLPLETDVRNTVSYGVSGTGKTGTYRGPPAPPSNFVSTATSPTEIYHTWGSVSGASSYLLISNEGSPVSFTPNVGASPSYSEGQSFSGGEIIHFGPGNSESQTSGIVANRRYFYALYAYDGSDYSIVASTNVVSTLDCSDTTNGEWIKVPGNPAYEANAFCVMKYEAKCSNADGQSCPSTDTPTSIAGRTPWVKIKQKMNTAETTATTACASIGAQLITNDQWMTIATNIANQASNWSDTYVGSGALNRGHSHLSNPAALAATAASEGSGAEKRTHTLSNGEVIWDMAGNVWEWTSDDDRLSSKISLGSTYKEFNEISVGTQSKTDFIPQVAIDEGWDSDQGIGQYADGRIDYGGALRRGGYWINGEVAGVFAANLGNASSYSNTDIGFRCVRL